MKENILPQDFSGVFYFTNRSDQDFSAKWDKVEYTFPANKTSPMIMNFTPVEIQNIRKKFAREYAEREFYKTDKFKGMNAHVPGGTPPTYTDSDLAPIIQQCLEPLPIAQATTRVIPNEALEKFNAKDEEGNPITQPIDKGRSLIKEHGSGVIND